MTPQAAKFLSIWSKSSHRLISVTPEDYNKFLFKLPPYKVYVQKDTSNVLYVQLVREEAIAHLQAEHRLYHVSDLR